MQSHFLAFNSFKFRIQFVFFFIRVCARLWAFSWVEQYADSLWAGASKWAEFQWRRGGGGGKTSWICSWVRNVLDKLGKRSRWLGIIIHHLPMNIAQHSTHRNYVCSSHLFLRIVLTVCAYGWTRGKNVKTNVVERIAICLFFSWVLCWQIKCKRRQHKNELQEATNAHCSRSQSRTKATHISRASAQ